MNAAAQAASSRSAQRLATTAVVIPARTARAAAISPPDLPLSQSHRRRFTGHGTLHARYGGRFLIPGSG